MFTGRPSSLLDQMRIREPGARTQPVSNSERRSLEAGHNADDLVQRRRCMTTDMRKRFTQRGNSICNTHNCPLQVEVEHRPEKPTWLSVERAILRCMDSESQERFFLLFQPCRPPTILSEGPSASLSWGNARALKDNQHYRTIGV